MRIFYTLLLSQLLFTANAQLVFIGQNAETPDEMLFVALEDIASGETFHVTDNEYDSFLNAFTTGEGIVSFSTINVLDKGDVFSLKNDGGWSIEGTSDVALGTVSGSLNISLGNEQTYLFATVDNSQTGNLRAVLSMVDTWIGSIASNIDPRSNFPNTHVIDAPINVRNVAFSGNRTTSNIADVLDLNQWNLSDLRIELDMTDFSGAALPVEITYFDGRAINNGNLLEWQTASELNNDKFVIEKSKNGRSFTAIDYVLGNGTTSNANYYDFVDKTSSDGTNYYRLKQVDYDGQFAYSNTIIIENIQDEIIDIYPTIALETVNVNLNANQTSQVVIYDQLGKSVINTFLNDGNNSIDVSNLTTGTYFMTIYMEGNPYVEKFIKR